MEAQVLFGGSLEEKKELVAQMSPLQQLANVTEMPATLLLHGTADDIVPYEQSVDYYRASLERGFSSEMVEVELGNHDGNFWTEEAHQIILEFFNQQLQK